ncbi:hypothetical protein [Caldanaerobacter subterraneus]|uniref:Uncharacterized protein n=1 Tax=Caldanaerobacter subterraneus TaxID=911092 RepID=A0A7Y2L7T9_9THEO|nr:hypothetical protein [Caldanaerobacter subterraneus]NNG67354.1 hypothetical protein [Caldanaerobacter subterraneus]
MKYTTNYNLKKPEGTDVVNIDDLNYNADIIDTELAARVKNSDFVLHLDDSLPHKFTDTATGKVYKYGLKQQDNHIVFMYQEVV